MIEPSTPTRILYHAGLGEDASANVPSISEVARNNGPLSTSLNDLLDTLEQLNLEVNGNDPTDIESGQSSFPRQLVYAVHELICELRRAPRKDSQSQSREERNAAAWTLEIAWTAILAGDIENIRQHIQQEEWARSGE